MLLKKPALQSVAANEAQPENSAFPPAQNVDSNSNLPSSIAVEEQPTNVSLVAAVAEPAPVGPIPSTPRDPIIVPRTGKISSGTMRPPQGRRLIIHAGATIMLLVIVIGTLVAVVPTGNSQAQVGLLGIFHPQMAEKVSSRQNNVLISAQAATATAVMHDGYEYNGAGGSYSWAGVNKDYSLGDGESTLDITNVGTTTTGQVSDADFVNPFTPGQCTYWADYRYHQLTGYEVTWSGNADEWAAGAAAAGWYVSSVPHVPSIMVLQPGVQGAAYGTGHVGVVESYDAAAGTVYTSNWNIVAPGVLTYKTYYLGSGVQFVWHP
ncbi:MAG TPA: CHAP domain-containing protein [Dictyobacter sp.]|jgi:surface antigen|nr:CHAP domain-containing protein [Dictyobacter sp.]